MNAVVPFPTSAEKSFGEQFRAFRSSPQGEAGGAARDQAYATFTAAGLPHRRIEAWHYTDLRSILREGFSPAPPAPEEIVAEASTFIAALPSAPGGRFVLLDGVYMAVLSTPPALGEGVKVQSILDMRGDELAAVEALGAPESVVALNAAFLQGGLALDIDAGIRREAPIEILSLTSGAGPAAIYTRSTIRLASGAAATLVERHAALRPGRSQANHVLIVGVGDGARFEHVGLLADLGDAAVHVGTMLARVGQDARFLSSTLLATGGVTRRQVYLEFVGPHSQAHFRGVSLLDGKCHADTTLIVTHTAPHCESRELYKHILDGESTGVYQGKVVVAPGAQKTDGKMLSKAVFLDEGSTMYNKPELEIFADDVVCGHGATVGSLDEDQLFYLRARGIPLYEAQALLLEAFADEAIEDVSDETLRAELAGRVGGWLRRRGMPT